MKMVRLLLQMQKKNNQTKQNPQSNNNNSRNNNDNNKQNNYPHTDAVRGILAFENRDSGARSHRIESWPCHFLSV